MDLGGESGSADGREREHDTDGEGDTSTMSLIAERQRSVAVILNARGGQLAAREAAVAAREAAAHVRELQNGGAAVHAEMRQLWQDSAAVLWAATAARQQQELDHAADQARSQQNLQSASTSGDTASHRAKLAADYQQLQAARAELLQVQSTCDGPRGEDRLRRVSVGLDRLQEGEELLRLLQESLNQREEIAVQKEREGCAQRDIEAAQQELELARGSLAERERSIEGREQRLQSAEHEVEKARQRLLLEYADLSDKEARNDAVGRRCNEMAEWAFKAAEGQVQLLMAHAESVHQLWSAALSALGESAAQRLLADEITSSRAAAELMKAATTSTPACPRQYVSPPRARTPGASRRLTPQYIPTLRNVWSPVLLDTGSPARSQAAPHIVNTAGPPGPADSRQHRGDATGMAPPSTAARVVPDTGFGQVAAGGRDSVLGDGVFAPPSLPPPMLSVGSWGVPHSQDELSMPPSVGSNNPGAAGGLSARPSTSSTLAFRPLTVSAIRASFEAGVTQPQFQSQLQAQARVVQSDRGGLSNPSTPAASVVRRRGDAALRSNTEGVGSAVPPDPSTLPP
eukprot:Hpha_TRINITY_DN19253_c0_g1::TRINITY_DN19253_c0_g1_i1::g.194388::m.194388